MVLVFLMSKGRVPKLPCFTFAVWTIRVSKDGIPRRVGALQFLRMARGHAQGDHVKF